MQQAIEEDATRAQRIHEPVMPEIVDWLLERHPRHIVDATVGTGGHAQLLLEGAPFTSILLGIDRDAQALELAAARLSPFGARVRLRQANFASLKSSMEESGFATADAVIADLGMSSLALDDPARGFSFRADGPLDMRMDRRILPTAYELVNEENEEELARIIFEYGEERASRRIARMIAHERRRGPIATTGELRALIERALGSGRRGRVHPATRTFQALRIAVNNEVANLRALLAQAPAMLALGGRLAVISYHSLEDREVKQSFRSLEESGAYVRPLRKAQRPESSEVQRNPRSRSARLRVLERVG